VEYSFRTSCLMTVCPTKRPCKIHVGYEGKNDRFEEGGFKVVKFASHSKLKKAGQHPENASHPLCLKTHT
jgi:hypothetical protein